MQTPLVSIIIPTYNRAHLIGETLDSILAQTYTNWECIVVDDGSTDETDKLLAAYCTKDSRFQYHQRPSDRLKGANSCRNYGFELCRGEYVNWFDSDDLMMDDFINRSILIFEDNSVDLVLNDYKIFEGHKNNIIHYQKNYTENLIEDYIITKINFGTWAIIWKKNVVFNEKFNMDLTRCQDLDFNFRIFIKKNFKYVNSNYVGLLLRKHNNTLTNDYKNNNIKSLISELHVRRYIILNVINSNCSKVLIKEVLSVYNKTLIKLIRKGSFKEVYKEVYLLLFLSKKMFKNVFWFFKFFILFNIFIISNKGDILLKNHLERIII